MKNWQIGVAAISSPEVAWHATCIVKADTEAEALRLAAGLGFTRNVRVREVKATP